MSLAALGSRVRIAFKDLDQKLDAVILEEESRGILLTWSMSSSTTGLSIILTQSCSPPVASTAQVRASEQTLKQSRRFWWLLLVEVMLPTISHTERRAHGGFCGRFQTSGLSSLVPHRDHKHPKCHRLHPGKEI